MSNTIDERVVEMRFDNKQFESNVATSMSTLDKLKQKLNLSGASKGLEDIDSASKKVNMTGLGGAVDAVKLKFSALEVMGVTALANITNSAVNAGKRIVSALTIDPIKSGFQEYETQINAVQTILANTESKGSTINDVNKALDTLNLYADKTIYNFTEMTRNIGTFTAAGVDLETSVSAIQGIANMAAVSGSTSQQASTAMYQLSQALAAGTVKLQDWNSVVNAGMGGQVFQDALKETSRQMVKNAESLKTMSAEQKKAWQENHGYTDDQMKSMQEYSFNVDELIKKNGSFRESLSEGWITADVLTMTLGKMTKSGVIEYVADMTGATKESITELQTLGDKVGYSNDKVKELALSIANGDEEMAKNVISTIKMATTAEDAATKVKTLTQLWDTLKEAAQSGWTQTWETVVGDFEEAKELYTEISDTIGGIISASAESRNKVLSEGLSTGWKQFINAAEVDEQILKNSIESVAKDMGVPIDELIEKNGSFEKSLKEGWMTSDILKKSISNLAKETKGLTDEQLLNLGYTRDQATAIKDLNEKVQNGEINLDEFAKSMARISGRENLIQGLRNVFNGLLSIVKPIKEAFREIFPPATGEQIYKLTERIRDLTAKFKLSDEQAANLKSVFKGLFSVLDIGLSAIKAVASGIINLLSKFKGLAGGILAGSGSIGDFLSKIRDSIKETNFFGRAIDTVVGFLGKAIDKIKEFWQSLMSGAKGSESGGIFGFFKGLWSLVTKVSSAIVTTLGQLGKKISEVLGKGDIFEVLNTGLIAGILLGVKKFTSGLNDAVKNVGGFMENVKGILDDVRGCLQAYQEQLKAGALLKIAGAIALLAASLFLLSTIDSESLGTAIIAITTLFAEIVGSMTIMNKFGGKSSLFDSTASNMIKMSLGILILASALKSLSGLSWEQMAVGLVAVSALLWELVAVSYVMSKTDSEMVKGSLGLIALAAAIKILASACKDFATMGWEQIGKGLAAVGGLLLEISIFENIAGKAKHVVRTGLSILLIAASMKIFASVLSDLASIKWTSIAKGLVAIGTTLTAVALAMKLIPNGSVFKATGLVIAAASLKIIANVLSDFGDMEWTNIGKGLTAMGGALAELAIGLNLMKGTLRGAAALMVAAVALAIIAPIMKTLGNLSWEQIAKGLIALAGAFAVIGVAGLLLKSLIWTILALSAAFVLFGAGMVGIGAGLVLISAGISALAVALTAGATAIVAGLTVIVSGILELVPTIARIIGEGIVEIAKVIGENAPSLIESCLQLVTSTLKALAEHAPEITNSVCDILIGVINGLADHMPALIEALVNLLAKVFEGLGKAIKGLNIGSLRDGIDAAIGLSALLLAMSTALKIAGSISPGKALKGVFALTAMAIPLMALVGVLALADGIETATKTVVSLIALAAACSLLLIPLTLVGNAGLGNALKGVIALTAMAVPMLAFVGVLYLMSGVDGAIDKVISLTALATACTLLLIPLTVIGLIATTGVGAAAIGLGIVALTAMTVPLLAFVGVLALMSGVDNAMTNTLLLTSFMTIMTDLLIKMALVGPLAVVGVTAMTGLTLLMGAIGILAVAVGALMEKFPSIQKFLDTGLPVLEQLAGSIGRMIGSFIGGIGEALSGSLVKIGADIAAFMATLSVASASASMIKGESFDGVKQLMLVMAEIGGTSILTGITDLFSNLLSGEDSMDKFVSDAKTFFNGMKEAVAPLDGVTFNEQGMNAIITAAERLSQLQNSLEPIGGVMTWFAGRDDLGTFGTNVASFIASMKTAFASLDGVEFNTIALNQIIIAASMLARLQSSIEPIGGVISWFKGRDDLGTFGQNVASFITSMKTAFSSLDGVEFNTAAINQIIIASSMLARLQSSIEPIGGVISWFKGRDDLGTFGYSVASFINSMKTAFMSLDDVKFNIAALNQIIIAAAILSKLQSSIEPIGGVMTWFTGRDDLGTFGTNVASFITSMKTAFASLDGVEFNTAAINQIIIASTMLARLQGSLESVGGVVDWFTGRDDLGTFGTNAASFITSMKTAMESLGDSEYNVEAMDSIIKAATKLAELQSNLDSVGGVVDWFTGQDDLGTFGENIGLFAEAMKKLKDGMGEDGISEDVVASVIHAGESIVSLQKALPEEGWFDGKMDLSEFAEYVSDFSTAMGEFGEKASNIDSSAVALAISTAYRIKTLINSLKDFDTDGLDTFIDDGIEELGEAMADFGDEVDDIDTEKVRAATTAALQLKTLISNLVDLDTSGVEKFKPKPIAEQISNYSEKVSGIDAGRVAASITAANRLKAFISGLANLETSGINKFKVKSIGDAIKSYGDAVSGINAASIISSISAATKVKTFVSSLAGFNASGVGAFKAAVNQLATTNVSGLVKAFSGASAKLSNAGGNMITGLIKGMQSKLPAAKTAVTRLVSALENSIKSKVTSFMNAGQLMVSRFATGISSKSGLVNAAALKCMSGAVIKIRGKYQSFYNAGGYLVDGFCKGITDKTWKAEAKAKAMAEAAIKAAKKELDINSPSKVFKKIGAGIPEGFAIGIGMLGNEVEKSTTDMASKAIASTKNAMNSVLDALSTDMDSQPTIRPVVDLSDVETGVNAISGLFADTKTIGVRSNLNAINSAMNRKLQNGSNDDVISAINKLNDSLANNRGDIYNFEGITYDDGSGISDAVQTLVRAARMGRRV